MFLQLLLHFPEVHVIILCVIHGETEGTERVARLQKQGDLTQAQREPPDGMWLAALLPELAQSSSQGQDVSLTAAQ